jgi:tetratricopeptide (TPR) repeat protein
LGQFEEAIAHYEIALSKAGDVGQEAIIYYNKGLAYASLMKWEQAINDYRLACEKINDPMKDQKERF